MSFSHPRGTRGGAMPRGPVMRLVNKLAARHVRRTGGQAMGMDLLVLHTVGRKSGEERTTPLARFSAPDGGWYVVASANGAVENPAWYLNMAAHPDRVSVELDGQRYTIRAGVHTLEGYSAHADQQDLLNFVSRMRDKPRQIRLVHGDTGAKAALAAAIRKQHPGIEVVVP